MAQENQQQDRADEELVPISEKVRSGLSNYRISLEKQQPDIIYRLYLEILKQYSFFNAFTGTADITLKDLDHPFIEPPPHDDIVSFINKLGYPGYLEQVSKMKIYNMYQPWRTFLAMINKCLIGKASGF
ncbi:hypothetical protein Tco_1033865 [Tanacetum coccineum]